jgi:integrase
MRTTRALKSKEQKQAMLRDAWNWNPKYYLMIQIGLKTGLRIGDILRLRVKDVQGQYKTLREQKTLKTRKIDFRGLRRDIDNHVLLFYLTESDYIIFRRLNATGKPLSRVRAWQIIRELADRHGLPDVATHSLRKTHAREYYARCGNIGKVQRRLNHKYPSTTWRYLVDESDLRGLLKKQ